ncbi:O-antigen ligase family protein [Legionella fairfieldensis]|uniref:O-antigen ligase family protein n=1 Tax=Legionella fairfieldensis TaxID=45064 RepID=UPI000687198A|nr:O-antigen ligase family protein [Legionella fairfieldensis]
MEVVTDFSPKLSVQRVIPFLLAASFLILPISSTGKSISLGLSMIAILSVSAYRKEAVALFAKGWGKAGIGLFVMACIACLWSPATLADKLFVVEKYSKLLYLPVLIVGFRNVKTRQMALHAFLLAMIITSSLAALKFNGYLSLFNINPDRVFRNHIISGLMGAFAAYLAILFTYKQQRLLVRLGYILSFLLLSYYLFFINEGRTGYIIYLLLMSLFMLQICSWRKAIAGIVIICSAFMLVYTQNSTVKNRVDTLAWEVKQYKQNNKNTSGVGFRLQFQAIAQTLFKQHPVFGNGTASFTDYFARENPVPAWGHRLWEPHNQYWLTLVEFGLVGFAILLGFFFSLLKACWRLDAMRPVALAALALFIVGNLSDSLLFYSGSGYFFILLMALGLSEKEVKP